MPHTLNRANQPIKQFNNNDVRKTMWPATDLAQARSPRLGERSVLTQAADSRLGEIATKGLGGFVNARLGATLA